jgi:uncharacterized protein YjbI with pentapeptide repeats
MAAEQPPWERCSQDSCIGIRLPTMAWCLAHAAEEAPDAFDAELKRIGEEGTVDLRGVPISAELLRRLLAAAPHEGTRSTFTAAQFARSTVQEGVWFAGATFHGMADFDGATFEDGAEFAGATFHRAANFSNAEFYAEAEFDGATFEDGAVFALATFHGEARFGGATFHGQAQFLMATFQDWADFAYVTFQDRAGFGSATFHDAASYDGATFQDWADFDGASFRRGAGFEEATFHGAASFRGATFRKWGEFDGAAFHGEVRFAGATFHGAARFVRATFRRATQVGPLLARWLVLDSAAFGARVQLEATAAALCARRAQFPAGVHLRLRYASIVLDDADLAAPAILAGAPSPFPRLAQQEEQVARGWQRLPPGPRQQRWRPRLLSVRRADVAGLRLADVDLCACHFAGAHNLDRLRMEGAPLFARTSGWWRARRKTLAEEQRWRANRPGRWRKAGWYPRACQPPSKAEAPGVLEPARLAALYRELRKGREDAKDEPGAADFYYGEMEMRRHDPTTPKAERLVLWAYWLLSGYALRAWRALVALAIVIMLAGVTFAFWGFPPAPPSFRPITVDRGGALVYQQEPTEPRARLARLPKAIRLSARSATALLRGPDRPLTPLGEWVEIGLRFAGPLLLGLAVLSVRGRVRR